MAFTEAVRTVFKEKYATFSGRASRSEYWWSYLLYVLGLIAFVIAISGTLVAALSDIASLSLMIAVPVIGGLLVLAALLPAIAVQVRRFHDRNISGWWYLALFIGSLVPYVGIMAGIAILVISVLKGTEGSNKFGPDPLRPEARAEVFA
ncbi:DUF805 domain-containing protein [Rhizobium redzepovicii]|uniref:DUF805 domain-containing protein n=1 Tax=Rhizobium redzepovicii TaxID=2867518 RepID=A0AAW8P276_9HYPH|nr:DUF805 domain-containing protein [Rhizobium redzepovicii]MDR9761090.1 DUF805 domain-containing protein [Rhizobium redzepovicii]MDR9782903.1 DUF805 domain-containing protein [Rhizobium redzepovicii]